MRGEAMHREESSGCYWFLFLLAEGCSYKLSLRRQTSLLSVYAHLIYTDSVASFILKVSFRYWYGLPSISSIHTGIVFEGEEETDGQERRSSRQEANKFEKISVPVQLSEQCRRTENECDNCSAKKDSSP